MKMLIYSWITVEIFRDIIFLLPYDFNLQPELLEKLSLSKKSILNRLYGKNVKVHLKIPTYMWISYVFVIFVFSIISCVLHFVFNADSLIKKFSVLLFDFYLVLMFSVYLIIMIYDEILYIKKKEDLYNNFIFCF